MDLCSGLRTGLLISLLGIGVPVVDARAQAPSAQLETVRTDTFAEGSPGVARVSQWLQAQLSPTDLWYGSPAALGQVTTTYTSARASTGAGVSADPPAPTASGAATGDTYAISSCSSRTGLFQKWTFAYNPGAGWKATAFDGVMVKSCQSGA